MVKNVTGYDLAKLYTGSLGSLAVIAEISFKLRPRFEKTATAIAEFATMADAMEVLAVLCERVRFSRSRASWSGRNTRVWLRFGEHPRAVEMQIAQLPTAPWKVFEGAEEICRLGKAAEAPARQWGRSWSVSSESRPTFRA